MASPSDTFTLNSIPRVLNRRPGSTSRPVNITGTYTGDLPTSFQYRVLKDATVVVNWTTVASFAASAGTWSGITAAIPQGGMYVMEVRNAQVTSYVVTSELFGIGMIITLYGQSNASRQPSSTPGTPVTPLATGWYRTIEGQVTQGNTPVQHLANRLSAGLEIPVCVVCGGSGNKTALALSPGSVDWTALEAGVGEMGGDVEAMYYTQGENDGSTNKVDYSNYVLTMRDRLLTVTGRTVEQFKWAWAQTGANTTQSNTRQPTTGNWQALREAQWAWCEANQGIKAAYTLDLPHEDNLHYTADAYVTLADRVSQSLLAAYLPGVRDGLGAGYRSAELVEGKIEIQLDLRGTTDPLPDTESLAISGWDVRDEIGTNFGTDSLVLDGTKLIITTKKALVGVVRVRNLWGVNPPANNLLKTTDPNLIDRIATVPVIFTIEVPEVVTPPPPTPPPIPVYEPPVLVIPNPKIIGNDHVNAQDTGLVGNEGSVYIDGVLYPFPTGRGAAVAYTEYVQVTLLLPKGTYSIPLTSYVLTTEGFVLASDLKIGDKLQLSLEPQEGSVDVVSENETPKNYRVTRRALASPIQKIQRAMINAEMPSSYRLEVVTSLPN